MMIPGASRKQNGLLRRVANALRQAGVSGETPLLVAVSGGPDSVCLLHVLGQLREKGGLKLHVAHLDHMLRGQESDADALYVAGLAQSLGIPVTVERRDAKEYQAAHGCSLEEAAREVRYQFFSGFGWPVATGHTADDQVETVLMHMVRGSGLNGLVGLRLTSAWRSAFGPAQVRVIRPLLGVARAETEAYCAGHGLEPRTDSTNRSLSPLRNRIRLELLPLLHGYNPDVDSALLRLSQIASDEIAFLDHQVSRVWEEVVTRDSSTLRLETPAIRKLPDALQRHLVRRALANVLGDVRDIESVHIEDAVKLLNGPAGKRLTLPGDFTLSVDYGSATLTRGQQECELPVLKGVRTLNIPGETRLPGWQVTARVLPHKAGQEQAEGHRATLDFDVAGADLVVRKRKPGERFQPLGMQQPKKLQDFMVDVRIPAACRDRVPLVCSPDGVLWVVGHRISEGVKVKPTTKKVLLLEFKRFDIASPKHR